MMEYTAGIRKIWSKKNQGSDAVNIIYSGTRANASADSMNFLSILTMDMVIYIKITIKRVRTIPIPTSS